VCGVSAADSSRSLHEVHTTCIPVQSIIASCILHLASRFLHLSSLRATRALNGRLLVCLSDSNTRRERARESHTAQSSRDHSGHDGREEKDRKCTHARHTTEVVDNDRSYTGICILALFGSCAWYLVHTAACHAVAGSASSALSFFQSDCHSCLVCSTQNKKKSTHESR